MGLPYDEAMSQGRIGLPVRNPEVPGSALKRSDEEWEQAVRFLLDEIPDGMLVRIFEEVRKDPGWLITHRFGIDMEVRNLLRAGVMALPPEDAVFKKNAAYIDLYRENWILYYGQSFPLQLLHPSVYSLHNLNWSLLLPMSTPPGTALTGPDPTRRDKEMQDTSAEVERLVRERTAELLKENEALRQEVGELKQAGEVLKKAYTELDDRVRERTAELERANTRLLVEIEERKRTEEVLRESKERFIAFMDNSPAGAWMKDEQGRLVYLNKALEARFKTRLQEWRGKTDFELWPLHVAEQFRENDLTVLEEGRVIEVLEETPNLERGGSTYWWNFKFPFQDASGKKYVGGIGIDITAWKRAEAALQESEEKYRNLAELAPEPIAVHRQGNIVYVNPPCVALFGAERQDDLIGKPTLQFVHPDDHEVVKGRIRQMAEKGTTAPLIIERFVKLDGQVIDVEVVATPIMFENMPSVMVLFRDITERKQAEENLKESEEKIRSILDRSLDALYRRNLLTGRSEYYSAAIEEITGFTVQETLAMTVDEILERVHPDDRPKIMAEKINVVSTATGGTVDYRFLCKDGTYRWVSDRFRIIYGAEGKPLFREGIVRDITEPKQAEAKLRAVMEREHLRVTELDATLASIASGVIIYDTTGAIVRVNEAVRNMIDRTSISFDPIHFEERRAVFGVLRPDGTPLSLEETPYYRALHGETVQGEEVMVTRLDREPLWVDTSAAPIRDGGGAIVGAIAILTDITERKRAEEALQRYAENLGRLHRDLETSNREANLYLDILTHDIGNTENVSNLYADLLIESLNGEAAGYVKKLQRSVQKSIEILGTVSTIRRIHRTKTELKPMDLDTAVRGAMEGYPDSIFFYHGAHRQVEADDLLTVVFNNLIGNAVKFGGPEVVVAVRTEQDDGFVRVSVEDTGPGVPDKDKQEIFQLYEMKKRGVGKGLGLYLVQILVERYGGKIWVEDRVPGRPEEGAAFKFTLRPALQTPRSG